jgi:hypothetical protein
MTSYIGLFAELEKIAEERQKYITKEKLKRHLLASGAVFTGGALGAFGGSALESALWKNRGRLGELARKHPKVMKYIPPAVAGIGAAASAAAAYRTNRHLNYIEKDNDRSK